MLRIQSKPKVRPAVSDPTLICITRGDPKLRRSVGLETFPNIQLFRTCMPNEGMNYFKMDASVLVERIINTHVCRSKFQICKQNFCYCHGETAAQKLEETFFTNLNFTSCPMSVHLWKYLNRLCCIRLFFSWINVVFMWLFLFCTSSVKDLTFLDYIFCHVYQQTSVHLMQSSILWSKTFKQIWKVSHIPLKISF